MSVDRAHDDAAIIHKKHPFFGWLTVTIINK